MIGSRFLRRLTGEKRTELSVEQHGHVYVLAQIICNGDSRKES